MTTSIVWFRRDLRLTDHPALDAARDGADAMVPVFCLEPKLLHGRFASGPRTQFMLECLAELDGDLAKLGSGLVIVSGDPAVQLPRLAKRVGADTVHAGVDAGPHARGRDRRVQEALKEADVALRGHPGTFVVDNLDAIRTQNGDPFQVFTPFHRAWLRAPRRDPIGKPRKLPPLPDDVERGEIPTLETLRLTTSLTDPAAGGERAAHAQWRKFHGGPVSDYGSGGHNALGTEGTSRLSPYLHFGCLSPRQLESELDGSEGAEEFRRQLAWRDFYGQVLRSFPQNTSQEFQQRYRATLHWRDDPDGLKAWKEGRTGFPLVDAGMRQLAAEGWMHNRARLVVGSFLTKDLGLDWREGEAHFMALLLDGDMANNNGNWQWIASVGVDPAPVGRRIFNPALQQGRYDPDGSYVRRHVPELKDVPDEFIAEPWTMDDATQRAANCVIGSDYPAPILDRKAARNEALERYRDAADRASK